MKIRGVYRWKLIDKKTDKVEREGSQENLITDSFTINFTNTQGQSKGNRAGRIVLSKQSTPLPSLEFREYGVASSNISRDTVSGSLSFTYDDSAGIAKCNNNFAQPGTPQTYTIFGLDLYNTSWYEFMSFVVLTTPVTQLTTQYLFVEYETYIYYSAGLLNSPINNYIKAYFNADIYDRMEWLAYRLASGSSDNNHFQTTPFRPPVTLNNVGRRLEYHDSFESSSCPNNGCRYGQTPGLTVSTTDHFGPVGVPVWSRWRSSPDYIGLTIGMFDNSDIVPSISRVFVHPASREWRVFSDTSYPPSSRASITLSGTPTNKFPLCLRLEITETGDASDITDETFTANPATDELTVSQDDWAVDDIVQFTTTGTLPSPLATSTDYYIVTKSGTSPTVLLEVSLSEGGAVVDITDAGTGTHTISRQITGRYRLTMQPIPKKLQSTNIVDPSVYYYQIFSIVDSNSEVMVLDDNSSPAYGLIGREGDYIYTVQYDSTGNQLMVCRQVLFTPESSVSLHSVFGTSGLTLYRTIRATGTYSDMVYIATSVGIYSYDLSSPATPTLMTITGMLSSDVRDLAFDEVTEYLWAGHYRGLSRINLGTNTATQYDNGVGDPLEGISDTYIEIWPGGLAAYNGFVMRALYGESELWLLQDGVGYAYTTSYGRAWSGSCIRKADGDIIIRTQYRWRRLRVTGITGPNTGSWSSVEDYDPSVSESYSYSTSHLVDLGDDTYRFYAPGPNWVETYKLGGTFKTVTSPGIPYFNINGLNEHTLKVANGSIPIDISEGDKNVIVQLSHAAIVAGSPPTIPYYGWTGSAWVQGNANDRQIIKTGTHSLGHGVSVTFNNAVGEDWDDQFVSGELFTFMISPTLVKDNLQTYTMQGRSYYCGVKRVNNWSTTIAATVTVPEAPTGSSPDADYRDLDTDTVVLEVYNVTTATYMTQVSSPPGDEEYSVTGLLDGTFEFHANQIGDTVRISYNYTCYW